MDTSDAMVHRPRPADTGEPAGMGEPDGRGASAGKRWLAALLAVASLGLAGPFRAGAQNVGGGKRPGNHPEFSEGVRAFENQEWAEAAERMRKALQRWPDGDGKPTRFEGRYFRPYLPHYYLGASLHRMGCYQAGLGHLRRSRLSQGKLPGTKTQHEDYLDVRQEAAGYVGQGVEQKEGANCSSWSGPGGSGDDARDR